MWLSSYQGTSNTYRCWSPEELVLSFCMMDTCRVHDPVEMAIKSQYFMCCRPSLWHHRTTYCTSTIQHGKGGKDEWGSVTRRRERWVIKSNVVFMWWTLWHWPKAARWDLAASCSEPIGVAECLSISPDCHIKGWLHEATVEQHWMRAEWSSVAIFFPFETADSPEVVVPQMRLLYQTAVDMAPTPGFAYLSCITWVDHFNCVTKVSTLASFLVESVWTVAVRKLVLILSTKPS